MRRCLLVATLIVLAATRAGADTTLHGSTSVRYGGNSSGGTDVPGGVKSGTTVIDYHAMQESHWQPQWMDCWSPNPLGPGWQDGESVNWFADFPAVGGNNHCAYTGTVQFVYWFGFRSVYINYQVVVTFVPD